jgi:type I restriction enzyme, S subunit
MKAGWQVKKLDEVCNLITCGVAAKPNYTDVGIPFLSAKNVKDGRIIWSGYNCVSEKTHGELTKHNKPLKGDILYTRVGSYGEAAVIEDDKEFSVFVSLTLIKPKKEVLNNYFLKHYLNSSEVKELAKRSISSSGVGNLNVGTVREFPINFPSLAEQQRILAILDQAFEGIAKARVNAEQNLQNARTLFESHLQSVFTQRGESWTEKSLSDIGITKTGSTPKAITKGSYGNFIPFIKPADFKKDGSLNYDNDGLSELGADGARKISAGSVLMVCIGATIGKCGFCDREITTNQQINSLTPKDIDGKFIYYQMLTNNFQNRVLHSSGQATLPIINKSKWSALKIGYPLSIGEQVSISDKLDLLLIETQRLEALYQRKIVLLDELKKSLLQQAFAGEL